MRTVRSLTDQIREADPAQRIANHVQPGERPKLSVKRTQSRKMADRVLWKRPGPTPHDCDIRALWQRPKQGAELMMSDACDVGVVVERKLLRSRAAEERTQQDMPGWRAIRELLVQERASEK